MVGVVGKAWVGGEKKRINDKEKRRDRKKRENKKENLDTEIRLERGWILVCRYWCVGKIGRGRKMGACA